MMDDSDSENRSQALWLAPSSLLNYSLQGQPEVIRTLKWPCGEAHAWGN